MYLALYRKYRPANFDEVVGQEHITTSLRNQIKNNTFINVKYGNNLSVHCHLSALPRGL